MNIDAPDRSEREARADMEICSHDMLKSLWRSHGPRMEAVGAVKPKDAMAYTIARHRLSGDIVAAGKIIPEKEPEVKDYLFTPPEPDESGNPFFERWRIADAVIESVAKDFGLTLMAIKGEARDARYVGPRAIIVCLLMQWGLSSTEVGRRLGGRDHSTVLNARRRFSVYTRKKPIAASYAKHYKMLLEAQAELEALREEAELDEHNA